MTARNGQALAWNVEKRLASENQNGVSIEPYAYDGDGVRVSRTGMAFPTGNLVGHWNFDAADVSGTTAYDASWSGHDGTLTNSPASVVGQLGQATSFNGTTQYMSVANSTTGMDLSGAFSVAFWAKLNGYNGTWQQLVWKRVDDGSGAQGWQIYASDTSNTLNVARWLNGANLGPNATYTVGTWQHWVLTYDGANLKLYRDGGQVGSTVADARNINGTVALVIGGMSGSQGTNGVLDDMRIYSRALTAPEVAGLAGKQITVYVNKYYQKEVTTVVATSSYYLGDRLIATKEGSTLRYVHPDSLGSSSVATDSTGNWLGTQTYKPFGENWISSGVLGTDRKFTGQRLDSGSGLYFYNARYCDAGLGRFTSAESIVSG